MRCASGLISPIKCFVLTTRLPLYRTDRVHAWPVFQRRGFDGTPRTVGVDHVSNVRAPSECAGWRAFYPGQELRPRERFCADEDRSVWGRTRSCGSPGRRKVRCAPTSTYGDADESYRSPRWVARLDNLIARRCIADALSDRLVPGFGQPPSFGPQNTFGQQMMPGQPQQQPLQPQPTGFAPGGYISQPQPPMGMQTMYPQQTGWRGY